MFVYQQDRLFCAYCNKEGKCFSIGQCHIKLSKHFLVVNAILLIKLFKCIQNQSFRMSSKCVCVPFSRIPSVSTSLRHRAHLVIVVRVTTGDAGRFFLQQVCKAFPCDCILIKYSGSLLICMSITSFTVKLYN